MNHYVVKNRQGFALLALSFKAFFHRAGFVAQLRKQLGRGKAGSRAQAALPQRCRCLAGRASMQTRLYFAQQRGRYDMDDFAYDLVNAQPCLLGWQQAQVRLAGRTWCGKLVQ
jgi:hypothetical protein